MSAEGVMQDMIEDVIGSRSTHYFAMVFSLMSLYTAFDPAKSFTARYSYFTFFIFLFVWSIFTHMKFRREDKETRAQEILDI